MPTRRFTKSSVRNRWAEPRSNSWCTCPTSTRITNTRWPTAPTSPCRSKTRSTESDGTKPPTSKATAGTSRREPRSPLRETTTMGDYTELAAGQVFDLSNQVIGLDRASGKAVLMAPAKGPPRRIDGYTVGAPFLTGDAPHDGEMHPDADELLFLISGRV